MSWTDSMFSASRSQIQAMRFRMASVRYGIVLLRCAPSSQMMVLSISCEHSSQFCLYARVRSARGSALGRRVRGVVNRSCSLSLTSSETSSRWRRLSAGCTLPQLQTLLSTMCGRLPLRPSFPIMIFSTSSSLANSSDSSSDCGCSPSTSRSLPRYSTRCWPWLSATLRTLKPNCLSCWSNLEKSQLKISSMVSWNWALACGDEQITKPQPLEKQRKDSGELEMLIYSRYFSFSQNWLRTSSSMHYKIITTTPHTHTPKPTTVWGTTDYNRGGRVVGGFEGDGGYWRWDGSARLYGRVGRLNCLRGCVYIIQVAMKPKAAKRMSHEQQRVKCRDFLLNFEDFDTNLIHDVFGRKKYMRLLQEIADEDSSCLEIVFEDLEGYFRKEDEKPLVDCFRNNTIRYMELFTEIAEELMPKRQKAANPEDEIRLKFENILKEQRRDNLELQNPSLLDNTEKIPLATHKNYDVAIVYGTGGKTKTKAISDLTAEEIGSLVQVKAIVVRASEIKPEIAVATYACDVCGCENYLEVFDNNYKPLDKCMSKKCIENKVNGKLAFLPGHSKFRSYQELRIQETPDQLRDGRIPRTYSLLLKDSNVKKAAPGDIIVIQAVMLPQRKLGFRHQHDLAFECHLQAVKIIREKKKYVEMALTADHIAEIEAIRASLDEETLFNRMAASIAPEIFGMELVKKALLLLMAGGVTKETHDNLKIRGEINIALIGDPGIAKSQLLKHITGLAPRAVYTTGKGSSGVGLTAAIVTDPLSKELALEAGALVLADMGICCIDEFDKMQEFDRTAIHEVMEQQTVSIAKAGITTTLNARTSILAAANPLYGRYNKKETIHKNINLPAALMSRFDLIFILLDECEPQRDLALARHIGSVHKSQTGVRDTVIFTPQFLRAYIALSKGYTPTISKELHNLLISKYIEKRQEQTDIFKEGDTYTTTRSLLALIRLCQARARLRFSNEVSQCDVIECLEIQEESQKNLGYEREERKPMHDYPSKIFEIIKDQCKYSGGLSVEFDKLKKRIVARGFTEDELNETLNNYLQLNLIMREDNVITLIEG